MRVGAARTDVVLVGGGHSHVQVLKRLAMAPVDGLCLTVVLDRPVAVYSGMVPGFVAGQYAVEELEIDVVPLARRAGARVVLSPAVGVESARSRAPVAGLDLPGVREHAFSSRPISRFVEQVSRRLGDLGREAVPLRLVVVGGGVGGVEVAFTLRERLVRAGRKVDTTLLQAGARLLPGSAPALVRRVEKHARRRAIEVECGV